MKAKIVFGFCLAFAVCVEVYGDGDHEARRGTYPFMAFIYYPDETVVDAAGVRFLRGAVLIRPEWLVTSAVGPSVSEGPYEFPRKTLLARLGAISVDSNFTLNEDEEEQEREVTQIIRPYNHSATQWWVTDISLMKTLLPFNTTAAVGFAFLSTAHNYTEKMCMILVFAKKEGSPTNDRSLMQYYIELMPPSVANCGSHFQGDTMTCGVDRDDNKISLDSNFCQGNSGGPLICEGDVMGIQTYIDNDCKQPHLYQLLSSWDDFIACGTQDRCQKDSCKHVCDVIDKDIKTEELTLTSTTVQTLEALTDTTIGEMETTTSAEKATSETEPITTEHIEEVGNTTVIVNTEPAESSTYSSTSEETSEYPSETRSWPLEKDPTTEEDTPERKAKLEARHQPVEQPYSDGHSIVSNFLVLFTGFYILAFLL